MAGVLAYLGKLLGENYARVGHWPSPVTKVVLIGLVIAYVIRVIRLRRAKRSRQVEDGIRATSVTADKR